jgi:nitroreductase
MELSEGLRTTGAARTFTDEAVDAATIAELLDEARFAPSGGNRQPWRVAVIDDRLLRRQLADLMQPVWNEYCAAPKGTRAPFAFGLGVPEPHAAAPNALLDHIEQVPVVLVVAADLGKVALMDGMLDRPPLTGGASIYPFCWNLLLAARARGLGGVMTTFLSRAEPAAAPLLHLPPEHALAATVFLGRPTHQPTKLTRATVATFTTIDHFDGPMLDD